MDSDRSTFRFFRAQFTNALVIYSRLAGIGALVGVIASVLITIPHGSRVLVGTVVVICALISTLVIAEPKILVALAVLKEYVSALTSQRESLHKEESDATLTSIETALANQSLEMRRLCEKIEAAQENALKEIGSLLTNVHSELTKISIQAGGFGSTERIAALRAEIIAADIQKLQSAADLFAQKVEVSLAKTNDQFLEQLRAFIAAGASTGKISKTTSVPPEQTELDFLSSGHISSREIVRSYNPFRGLSDSPHYGPTWPALTHAWPREQKLGSGQGMESIILFIDPWFDPHWPAFGHHWHDSPWSNLYSRLLGQRLASQVGAEISGIIEALAKERDVTQDFARLWAAIALMMAGQSGQYESALTTLEEALKSARKSR